MIDALSLTGQTPRLLIPLQATNQKNLTTYAVSSTFSDEFQSIQSCLPVAIGFVTANNASVTSYKFKVNSTSLECALSLAL